MDPVVEALPRFVEPMLLEHRPPTAPAEGEWAIEVKFDGIRAQLRLDGGCEWTVRSRPGRGCSAQFPKLAELAEVVGRRRVIFDGELVHLAADGRPDLSRLRRHLSAGSVRSAASAAATHPVTLVGFDVLHVDGRAVREFPYRERRAFSPSLWGSIPGGALRRRGGSARGRRRGHPRARARCDSAPRCRGRIGRSQRSVSVRLGITGRRG